MNRRMNYKPYAAWIEKLWTIEEAAHGQRHCQCCDNNGQSKRKAYSGHAQIVVCSSNHPDDKKFNKELSSHLKLLTQRGISIWNSMLIEPGLDTVGEMLQAVASSKIVILLVSINLLLDPLIEQAMPLLSYRSQEDGLRLIPILLRPCEYSLSAFAHIPLVNSKPLAEMVPVKREEFWKDICSQMCSMIDVQTLPPHLNLLFMQITLVYWPGTLLVALLAAAVIFRQTARE